MNKLPPHVAASIKSRLDRLLRLDKPAFSSTQRDPVAYAAALEVLG